MEKLNSPIFYDPKHRRWQRFKKIFLLIASIGSIIFGMAITSVLINPVLPTLGLDPIKNLPHAQNLIPPARKDWLENNEELPFQKIRQKLDTVLANIHPSQGIPVTQTIKQSEIMGYYVNWDDASFTSLKENLSHLDKLLGAWLNLNASDGSISVDSFKKLSHTLTYIRQYRSTLSIVPVVNNFNEKTQLWDSDRISDMLKNPDARNKNIQELLKFVRENGCAGINIDYENIPTESQSTLIVFMKELYNTFHPLGLEVSLDVPLDEPSFDYKTLAKYNDYLILMAYDEHWSEGKPGPIVSQGWYVNCLRRRFADVPADKYVIAIGNYGYDWKADTTPATDISFQEAINTAQESEASIKFDPTSLNPTFDYYDENDKLHHVWFLDAITAFNQILTGQSFKPRGFALWRLGSEEPSIWKIFGDHMNLQKVTAQALCKIHPGYAIDYKGQGEVLKVAAIPYDGERKITYDEKTNLISDEHLTSYPSPYIITRWGGKDKKKIALTFDDGPDAIYTSRILDILHCRHVPATFFVIGLNSQNNLGLLRRIVADGHEVGNHTFTHPNIATISGEQLKLELNTTERMFESQFERCSVLFRPPYAEDVEPETPDQVTPLMLTSNLGYYTIGMQIDTEDWRRPGADNIVKDTITQAVNGTGNIVLLHDGGGNRSQTVEALPQLIDGLRAHGFELVTVSDLIGLKHDDVMPSIPANERVMSGVNEVVFAIISWFITVLYFFFISGVIIGSIRFIFIGTLAVSEALMRRHIKYSQDYAPSVSVIVPAYNEEKVICKTIHSLLNSTYSDFEIIVVDDGSTDGTRQCTLETFGNNPKIQVLTKPNGGKAEALNYGIMRSQSEIIITMDGDTIFLPDTIKKLVRHFVNPRVAVVAGNAKVGNRINILTNWQALEYITSQNLERRAFDALNCITVVPGAIGAWRRTLILDAGGFKEDTLAEDADLTLATLRMGHKISYEEEAIALTEAPDTIPAFLKQRFRWMYGTLQTVWKHRDAMFRPKYGTLGMFAIPNIFIFQFFFPILSPIMDFFMTASLILVFWQQHYHPKDYSTDTFKHVIFYYALFLAIDFMASFIAFVLEKKEDWRLLIWIIFQRFVYRQLIYYIAFKSFVTAIKGKMVGWGKLERKATVQ